MPLPLFFRNALEQRDDAALEAAWLAHVAEEPGDIETFSQVAAALDANSGLASVLLELLDDEIRGRGLWDARLALIKAAGRRFLKTGTIHETVISTLEELYADRQQELAVVLPAVGLNKSKDDTPKLWDKVERLRNLLTFQVGTVVAMKEKGVGRVVEVNVGLQTLKVDFERNKGVAVGFLAAGKMLELLDEGHFLRRKLEEPEELLALGPPTLLQAILESYDRPLTAAEIKGALDGLIPMSQWSSWWAAARKNPQVLASSEGRRTYSWATTNEAAEEHLWAEFEAADLAAMLDLARRSNHLDDDLKSRMGSVLAAELQARVEGAPHQAFEIWTVVERLLGETPWQPGEMIQTMDDPLTFVTAIEQRAVRQRAYRIVREQRDDWLDLYAGAFAVENDLRLAQWLAEEIDSSAPEVAHRAFTKVLKRYRLHPVAFVYLAARAADDESLREQQPLRLLKQILSAIGHNIFASQRARLLSLFESGSTLPRLLSHLADDQAAEAERTLERARGIDDYLRKPLINALHLRFPGLRKANEQPLYTTAESLEAKRQELKTLLEEEIPANRKAIETARELGDLRENFEYKSARQRHEYLSARASALNRDLERARIIEPAAVDPTEIRIGTTAALTSADEQRRITVLGPWESAPENGVVSFESELAQRMLGKKVGDSVELDGVDYDVESIAVFES